MVVNGNLVVKDTFAYHGILIVTGDLVIQPTLKKDAFDWSEDGWPLATDGLTKLRPGDLTQDFESYTSATYNDWRTQDGLPTKLTPAPGREEYRGKLVLQGKLLVMGRIITPTVSAPAPAPAIMAAAMTLAQETAGQHVGDFNVYFSSDAINEMRQYSSLGNPVMRRVSWVHDDGIDAESLWQKAPAE
jgi:hypothetical protein